MNFKSQFYHFLDEVLQHEDQILKNHLENDHLFRRVFPKKLYEFSKICDRFLE